MRSSIKIHCCSRNMQQRSHDNNEDNHWFTAPRMQPCIKQSPIWNILDLFQLTVISCKKMLISTNCSNQLSSNSAFHCHQIIKILARIQPSSGETCCWIAILSNCYSAFTSHIQELQDVPLPFFLLMFLLAGTTELGLITLNIAQQWNLQK